MTSQLLRDQALQSAEHWNGIDIYHDELFDFQREGSITTTTREQHAADVALTGCVRAIAQRQPKTIDFAVSEFSPSREEFADGTVFLLDQEHLYRRFVQHADGSTSVYQPPAMTTAARTERAAAIEKPYLHYWQRQQASGQTWKAEQAFRMGNEMVYAREVLWAVLITRKNNSRMLVPYPLAHVAVANGEVTIHEGTQHPLSLPQPLRHATARPTKRYILPDSPDADNPDKLVVREARKITDISMIQPERDRTRSFKARASRVNEHLQQKIELVREQLESQPALRPIPVFVPPYGCSAARLASRF